jgi:hypothetical protein
MDQELTALIPDDVAFFIGSKLRYFFQHRAYGEIRIKIAEGLPHTYHYTESYRAKKRTRRTDTPNTVTASQSQD